MKVIAIRTFGNFTKGMPYTVPERDGQRWIAQDMMAPLDHGTYSDDWRGATAAIIASGPSLTKADVERVRKWRAECDSRRVIVVNASYQLAPWADVLIALDRDFWTNYQPDFSGAKITQHGQTAQEFECFVFFADCLSLRKSCNSGLAAVDFAAKMGAARVLLLGFDGQLGAKGKAHWHGDHPNGMMNATNIENWPAQADQLAAELQGAKVINCTRRTALTAWPTARLEDELC